MVNYTLWDGFASGPVEFSNQIAGFDPGFRIGFELARGESKRANITCAVTRLVLVRKPTTPLSLLGLAVEALAQMVEYDLWNRDPSVCLDWSVQVGRLNPSLGIGLELALGRGERAEVDVVTVNGFRCLAHSDLC